MNDLRNIIETIITKEIQPDEGVFSDGYVITPVDITVTLKGDGVPQELVTQYQIDFFYKQKGETMAKAKSLIMALSKYAIGYVNFTWEETARLWRATLIIETI